MKFKYSDFALKFRKHQAEGVVECLKLIEETTGKFFNDEEYLVAKYEVEKIEIVFKRKWNDTKISRKWDKFTKKYSTWLNREIEISPTLTFNPKIPPTIIDDRGRPHVPFADCSERTKSLKRSVLIEKGGNDPLLYLSVAESLAKKEKNKQLASSINHVYNDATNHNLDSTLRRLECSNDQMSPNQALSMYLESNVSRRAYQTIRQPLTEKGINVLPSNYNLRKQRLTCYPEGKNFKTTMFDG